MSITWQVYGKTAYRTIENARRIAGHLFLCHICHVCDQIATELRPIRSNNGDFSGSCRTPTKDERRGYSSLLFSAYQGGRLQKGGMLGGKMKSLTNKIVCSFVILALLLNAVPVAKAATVRSEYQAGRLGGDSRNEFVDRENINDATPSGKDTRFE